MRLCNSYLVIRKNRTGGPGTTQDQHKNKREEDQRGDGRDRRGTPTPRVRHPPKKTRNRTDQQGTPASSRLRPQTPVSPPRNPSEELHDTQKKELAKRSNHTRMCALECVRVPTQVVRAWNAPSDSQVGQLSRYLSRYEYSNLEIKIDQAHRMNFLPFRFVSVLSTIVRSIPHADI